jgi:hypothetical protein
MDDLLWMIEYLKSPAKRIGEQHQPDSCNHQLARRKLMSSWFGDGFSRFLRRVGDSASIEYLADTAELERARIRADRAPKGVPVGSCRLSSVLPRRFETMLVDFHPSASLIASRFPL